MSAGGKRTGAIAGGVVGSPTFSSICRAVADSLINATRRTHPRHPLQFSANTHQMRASNRARGYRAGCPACCAAICAHCICGGSAATHRHDAEHNPRRALLSKKRRYVLGQSLKPRMFDRATNPFADVILLNRVSQLCKHRFTCL